MNYFYILSLLVHFLYSSYFSLGYSKVNISFLSKTVQTDAIQTNKNWF